MRIPMDKRDRNFRNFDDLPVRRRTRRAERSSTVHRQTSEMHRAIHNGRLCEILDKQEKDFCIGDGVNCFILAALTEGRRNTGSKWQLVHSMLKINRKGVTAKNEDGSTLLMYFANCPRQVRCLADLGADINHVDMKGYSVLMRAFLHPKSNEEAFLELLKLGADPNVPPGFHHGGNIIEFMLRHYLCLQSVRQETARKCLSHILQPEYFHKIDCSKFKAGTPVFTLLKAICKGALDHQDAFFMSLMKQLPKTNLLMNIDFNNYVPLVIGSKPKFMEFPDLFLLDPLSFFYFTLTLSRPTHDLRICVLQEVTTLLLQNGLQDTCPNVLPPGLALMCGSVRIYDLDPQGELFKSESRHLISMLLQENVPRLLASGEKIFEYLLVFLISRNRGHFFCTTKLSDDCDKLILKTLRTLPKTPNFYLDDLQERYSSFVKDDIIKDIESLINENVWETSELSFRTEITMPDDIVIMNQPNKSRMKPLKAICRAQIRHSIHSSLNNSGEDLSPHIAKLGEMGYISLPMVKYVLIYK